MDAGTATTPLPWETISAGPFEFRFTFRDLGTDRGATLEVYGGEGEKRREVLKFDCFEKGPHWHRYHAEADVVVLQLEPKGMDAGVSFAVHQLTDHLGTMMAEQGFHDLASDGRLGETAAAVPELERQLRELVRANS